MVKTSVAASISTIALFLGVAIGLFIGTKRMHDTYGDAGAQLTRSLVTSAHYLSNAQGEPRNLDGIAKGIVGSADLASVPTAQAYCGMSPSQQRDARNAAERLEKSPIVVASGNEDGHRARLYMLDNKVGTDEKCVPFKI